jgi:hypothetical protein
MNWRNGSVARIFFVAKSRPAVVAVFEKQVPGVDEDTAALCNGNETRVRETHSEGSQQQLQVGSVRLRED